MRWAAKAVVSVHSVLSPVQEFGSYDTDHLVS